MIGRVRPRGPQRDEMADCKRYEGITREKLEQLKQELVKKGLKPPEGDSGTIEAMGVKLSLSYAAPEQALEICIVEKPDFIPAALVWSQVEASLKV
jgi:hypothetical protein